jgi:hypothetical protein
VIISGNGYAKTELRIRRSYQQDCNFDPVDATESPLRVRADEGVAAVISPLWESLKIELYSAGKGCNRRFMRLALFA